MKYIFPETTKRVQMHTNEEINHKIREQTLDNISKYANCSREEIEERLKELNAEWDIERVLEVNAASAILATTILGFRVNKLWFIATGIVGGFLLQHALQGWCPPVEVFRKLGIRTSSEINCEKDALESFLDKGQCK